AQAAADDDEIVRLARVVRAGQIPLAPIAELMRHLERSGMAAAHADAGRRVIVRRLLGGELLLRRARELRRPQRTDDAQGRAVQEVAARDCAVHAERAVMRIHAEPRQAAFTLTRETSRRASRSAAA